MKTPVLITSCFMLLLSAPQDDLKKELALFAGTWQPYYVEIDGKEHKGDISKDRLVISGTTFTFTTPKGKSEGKFRIDPTAKPRTIDEEITDGDNKGTKTVGIYEIDAKRLMVCYTVTAARPTEFATSEKSGRFLILYKRVP
jgi:uncharacterized protein (TIGR03067 family)